MSNINYLQKNFIDNCFSYLRECKKKNINIAKSPLCFFTVWAKTPGQFIISRFLKKTLFSNIAFTIKNILSLSYNHDLELFSRQKDIKLNQKKIIVSYSSKANFDKNGNFYDVYFNIGSKEKKNFLWFLISLDNYAPDNLKKNIFIVKKRNTGSVSFLYLVKKIINLFTRYNFSFSKIKHNCWYESDFAYETTQIFKNFIEKKNFEKLLINYESTPWQNSILLEAKRDNNIKTYGYLHCAPWPVQTDLINRNIFLDKLYVSSRDQKKNLCKNLGWKQKKVSVIPSLRFSKFKKRVFNGYIFPPYNLDKKNDYLIRLEKFFKDCSNKSLNKLRVRIHPLNQSSHTHLKFKDDVNNLIKKYKNKFSKNNKNISLFFGSATGVCVQALEEGTKIFHFPNDNPLDVFSSSIWENINVKKINNNTYLYNLKKYNRTFFINKEKNKFSKYINF